jgi:hypothetical protein
MVVGSCAAQINKIPSPKFGRVKIVVYFSVVRLNSSN